MCTLCVSRRILSGGFRRRYGSKTLKFGKVDANKYSELAAAHNIAISTMSWQLPTLILFQGGDEVFRLPKITADGKVVKTILDKVRWTLEFGLCVWTGETYHVLSFMRAIHAFVRPRRRV